MKHWLVVTLLLPKVFEDGISNFLMEGGATGIEEIDLGIEFRNGSSVRVDSDRTGSYQQDSEWKRLKAYFPLDGKEKKVLRALRRYLKSLQSIAPEMGHAHFEAISIPEQDWGEKWKKNFKPLQVTSKFVVRPPWSKMRLKKGQIPLVITPGMAFGTGTHETTKLSIQALEERLRKKGLSILDLGTGSGILSIAAARLGAEEVWGLDIDGLAVEAARENVGQNGVSDIVRIREGRIGDIRKKFDVIVANIDFKGLKRIRWPLLRHLKDRGFLILSGVLEEEEGRLLKYYTDTGCFQLVKLTRKEEWVCLTLKKK